MRIMLSDTQIKRLIQEKHIEIEPYREESLKTGIYEVHLGNLLLIPEKDRLIDLRDTVSDAHYDRFILDENGYVLEPHAFILGQTLETFAFSDDIGAFIDGKSTLARLGISIHQSAMILMPGQGAHIVTLEIYNAGSFRIKLYPEMPIAKIIFFQSLEKNENPYRNHGKYAGQKETTGARIM
jgi:dCTP deaminase